MTKINDGGPAFPVPDGEAANLGYHGASLREWFAGQALAGVWAGRESDFVQIAAPTATDVAKSAYAIADAMLAQRAKGGSS